MDDDFPPFCFGWAAGLLSGTVLFGAVIGPCANDATRKDQQEAAIKAGVARWEVNPATGETRFVYGVTKGATK